MCVKAVVSHPRNRQLKHVKKGDAYADIDSLEVTANMIRKLFSWTPLWVLFWDPKDGKY